MEMLRPCDKIYGKENQVRPMKITIRVTNAYQRAAPDFRPSPPEISPPAAPPVAEKTPPKVAGVKNPPEAAVEATSIAVAKELNRLRSIADAASAAKKQTAPPPASPAPASRPASKPAPVPAKAAAEKQSAAADAPPFVEFGLEAEPGLSAIQSRFKILIVDDDPIIVRLLTHFLSKSNYEVRSVTEGMEGLKIAFAEKPDLILLDVMMPGMDGFRFLELLKKGKRFANVPVLMISALVEEDQVLRALEAGATDYIVKPFSSRIVLAKVHKALKDLL